MNGSQTLAILKRFLRNIGDSGRHGEISIPSGRIIEQGRLLRHREVQAIAQRHKATPAQVALAWVMRLAGVIAIPKAGSVAHAKENRAALDLRLTTEDFAALDKAFPPPRGPKALEML